MQKSNEMKDEAEAEENVAPSSAILPPVVNEKSSGIASLQNVSTDPEINKDASFLDAIQKVFEENDTSILFKPHLNKMKLTFYEARRSVKKRIITSNANQTPETNVADIMREDDNNIFDILQNM